MFVKNCFFQDKIYMNKFKFLDILFRKYNNTGIDKLSYSALSDKINNYDNIEIEMVKNLIKISKEYNILISDICLDSSNVYIVPTVKILIYVLYHDDVSELIAKNLAKKHNYLLPYKMNTSLYYESGFYLDYNNDDIIIYDFIGTISYKYAEKIKEPLNFLHICQKWINCDIVTLFDSNVNLLNQAKEAHGDVFIQAWTSLMKHFYDKNQYLDANIPTFFCNYWLAKPKIFNEYCKNIRKINEFVFNDKYIVGKMLMDANYKVGKLSIDKLLTISGKPYYTLYGFILERYPCLYFYHNNYKIALRTQQKIIYLNQYSNNN